MGGLFLSHEGITDAHQLVAAEGMEPRSSAVPGFQMRVPNGPRTRVSFCALGVAADPLTE